MTHNPIFEQWGFTAEQVENIDSVFDDIIRLGAMSKNYNLIRMLELIRDLKQQDAGQDLKRDLAYNAGYEDGYNKGYRDGCAATIPMERIDS